MSRYALMGGTLACAVGIGFFMQQSPTAQARYGSGVEVASIAPTLPEGALRPDAIDAVTVPAPVSDAVPVPVPVPVPLAALIATETAPAAVPAAAPMDLAAADPDATMTPDSAPLSQPSAECEPSMSATARDLAMVHLVLTSCQPGARVTIHHNGMMVQAQTDAAGRLDITLPALAEQALFIAELPDRSGAVAQATVASLAEYDRVVLQWRGDAGFMLGAYEFGAGFGDDGHRDRDRPGSVEAAIQGQGGLLTSHGDLSLDNGLRAEAYTFPRGTAQQAGSVALAVETEVTAANCGQDVAAQSLQISGGQGLEVRELTLAMPDCAAVGDYIVLKNMAEDLKIAAN